MSPSSSDGELGTNETYKANWCDTNPQREGTFDALVLDQLATIQRQNEWLKTRLLQVEKEQEEFYLSGYKRMERGFRDVDRCCKEVTAMKEVFKEVVGVMTGDRVRFLDHSNENVSQQEADHISESLLLPENLQSLRENHRRQFQRDASTLHPVKVEEQDDHNHRILHANQHDTEEDPEHGSVDGDAPEYRLNRAIQTVTDVAREYFEGLRGKPSVLSLERRYGATWRKSPGERCFFAKRMAIVNKINDVAENPQRYNLPQDLTRKMAIKVVENVRLGNNSFNDKHVRMTLNQLYMYFSKNMDQLEDYALTLKHVGKTRRQLLTRERMEASRPHET